MIPSPTINTISGDFGFYTFSAFSPGNTTTKIVSIPTISEIHKPVY
jgi:hypothetical protein